LISRIVPEDKFPVVLRWLKILFALGLVASIDGVLSQWALNNWIWSPDKKKWVWEKEVAVVTGGSGAIGGMTAKGLAERGVKVAIMDVTPLPADMQNSMNSCCPTCTRERFALTLKKIRTSSFSSATSQRKKAYWKPQQQSAPRWALLQFSSTMLALLMHIPFLRPNQSICRSYLVSMFSVTSTPSRHSCLI
jgi:hypothetical protein